MNPRAPSGRTSDIAEAGGELTTLYGAGRYSEMLPLARAFGHRFPDYPAMTTYWLVCTLCLNGASEEALAVLQRAAVAGCWWNPRTLREDPDLATLQGLADFEQIVAESAERASSQSGVPRLLTLRPDGAVRGLLLALHGASSRVEGFAPYWRGGVRTGFLVGVPQSSLMSSSDGYGWPDPQRALAEVGEHLAVLVADAGNGPIVVAGFSQGGRLALSWVLSGQLPATTFVTIGAAIPEPMVPECAAMADGAVQRGVNGRLLVGDRDGFLSATRRLHQELAARNMHCDLDVLTDLGHTFPPDFGDRLQVFLAELLGT